MKIVCMANPNNYIKRSGGSKPVYTKRCPKCGRQSYSSISTGGWRCPYDDCGADLTTEKAAVAK